MLVIGLTGGIGSGKTTVAQLFADLNVPIIDADVIAREITQPSGPAFQAIVDHFSSKILLPTGNINRTLLAEIVFNNTEERDWLEKLLHPRILKAIEEKIAALNTDYCIVVIPLLLEKGPFAFINRILIVDTTEELQIKRTAERDKTSHDLISAVMKTQTARSYRLQKANDVIINDGQMIDLILQVEKMHSFYMEISKHE